MPASSAVTVTEPAVPAVPLAGMLTVKWVAGPGATASGLEVPVMPALTVSVAVMVWQPAVSSVSLKVPTPLVSVVSAGNTAMPSVEVKWTVPV